MSSDAPQPTPARPSGAQRLAVAAFLLAFGLTILTVILTGLAVKAPRSHEPAPAAAGAAPEPDRGQ
jgi:hypothetical protein